MSTPDPAARNSRARFWTAVRAGDVAAAGALLDRDPELIGATANDSFGATPLITAVNRADRPMIDLLLARGADIDARSDWAPGSFGVLDSADDETAAYLLERGATLTPHAAARLGEIDALGEMLDADPTLVHARGGDGQFPLHFARTPEVAAFLLERGADIDAVDIDHASTAAQWAVTERPEVAGFLVARGAAPDVFMAAVLGDVALLRSLLPGEPDGAQARITQERFGTTDGGSGHEAMCIYHFSIGTDSTLLHAAAHGGHEGMISALVADGADPGLRGGYDDATPLHIAAWHDRPKACDALLDAGAEIDARSGKIHHNTPLGWAIVAGSVGAVERLLARGAAVLDFMPSDAAAGARGQFRQFRPERPLAQWERIERLLAPAAERGETGSTA